jgi:hypothetical protein
MFGNLAKVRVARREFRPGIADTYNWASIKYVVGQSVPEVRAEEQFGSPLEGHRLRQGKASAPTRDVRSVNIAGSCVLLQMEA